MKRKAAVKNALTVDVEDWYQTHDFDFQPGQWERFEDRVEYSTCRLLELFARHNVRATFFVLGYVAKKHPGLVRKIASEGHEIGCHGSLHRKVSELSRGSFRKDLEYSKKTLEGVAGRKVVMYRAPSWSIDNGSLWALEVLEEEGLPLIPAYSHSGRHCRE